MSDTAALLGSEKEKPISYTMFVLWVGGIESSVCNLLRCVLIVCVITPWCNGSGTIQSFPSLSRAHCRPSRRMHSIRRKNLCCLAAFLNHYRSGAVFEECNDAALVLYAESSLLHVFQICSQNLLQVS